MKDMAGKTRENPLKNAPTMAQICAIVFLFEKCYYSDEGSLAGMKRQNGIK